MNYLQETQYYIDRYDLHTIKECLDVVRMFQDVYQKCLISEELQHLPEEEKLRNANILLHRTLFEIKGKRFENKQEIIQKWMEEDKLKQDKQDYTPEPNGIICPLCSASMFFNTSKYLDYYNKDNQIMRMVFLFKCSKCKKQQWVYDDGEIRVSEPRHCPECNKEIEVTYNRKGKVIIWKYKCNACGHTDKEVEDFAKKDKEKEQKEAQWKKEAEEDKKILDKYRNEYSLSEKDGKEYVETLEALDVANEVYEEEKQKYDDKAYQIAISLKKLKIIELEKLLSEKLLKENYVNFSFYKPDMGRYLIVPFSVLDATSTRRQKISEDTLKKLIKVTLEDTNWRLMSDGVHYRLGYLSGSLKAYELEEDLLQLTGAKKIPKASKIDPEKRTKYSSHYLVQLARGSGEFDGIEETRKRRLQKEPEGFFLNVGDGPYSCGICSKNAYGEDIWWNLDGLRCRDCRRNIKEGVIPSVEDRYNRSPTYFQDWQLKHDYGVYPSSVKKLRKEKLLNGRDLKHEDGTVYKTIYLMSENKKFLQKYPRIDNKSKKVNIETKRK